MDPKIFEIINEIFALKSKKGVYIAAIELAKKLCIPKRDIHTIDIDIIFNLPDISEITIRNFRHIVLMGILHHRSLTTDTIKHVINIIDFMRNLDERTSHDHLDLIDYFMIDIFRWLTGYDKKERPCPQCPIRKKN